MKIVCMMLTFISISAFGMNEKEISFEHHIEDLLQEGHIDNQTAKNTILKNDFNTKNLEKRKARARGIASTLSKVKVYKIVNKPIEIQP